MSHRRAKKIRKALFAKGVPLTDNKYYRAGATIIANQPRRIYKALKRKPLKEALEIVGRLVKAQRPKEEKKFFKQAAPTGLTKEKIIKARKIMEGLEIK